MRTVTAKPTFQPRPGHQRGDFIWNALTILVLVGILALGGCFISVYTNPQSGLNLFPPAAQVSSPTPAATATPYFPPTWTPSAAEATTPAESPAAALVTEVTQDPPAETPQVSSALPQAGSGATFGLANNPTVIASTLIHPDRGCQWTGIGGQVFDLQGRPLVQQNIRLEGEFNGSTISMLALTGTETLYGAAGYEFDLGATPVISEQSLALQLVDPAGLPLSDPVPLDTFSDCSRNLVLVNFRQLK